MHQNTRAPELDPLLQVDTPTLATLKSRALWQLAEAANTVTALIELVRGLQGIKEPEKYAPWYRQDDWYQLVQHGQYAAARSFILEHHA